MSKAKGQTPNAKRGWAAARARLKAVWGRFHRDERGAIAILVLLTIWCLVALLGLLWNTMEVASRRERIQTAADAAAYSAQAWVARTMNAVNAQNMVIAQDAATETVWRSIPPTADTMLNTLKENLETAERMRAQGDWQASLQRLKQMLQYVDNEYSLTIEQLKILKDAPDEIYGKQVGYPSHLDRAGKEQQLLYQKKYYPQAETALNWVYNTYVFGQPPKSPDPHNRRPGLTNHDMGLNQIVEYWMQLANENQILDYIENYIDGRPVAAPVAGYTYEPGKEYLYVDKSKVQFASSPAEASRLQQLTKSQIDNNYPPDFLQKTGPATSLSIPDIMAVHQHEVYLAELDTVKNLKAIIEAQRKELADLYQANITLATLNRDAASLAPLMAAADVPRWGDPATPADAIYRRESADYVDNILSEAGNPHTDYIRQQYPTQASNAGMGPTFIIDPINVHVDPTNNINPKTHKNIDPSRDTRIWHPGIAVPVPSSWKARYPSLPDAYPVSADFPGGWGHIWAAPLERYVHERASRDSRGLNADYMAKLDYARSKTLAKVIRKFLGFPNDGQLDIDALPRVSAGIKDDQPPAAITLPSDWKPGDPDPAPDPNLANVREDIRVPPVLPELSRVNGVDDKVWSAYLDAWTQYNEHVGRFMGAVQRMRGEIISHTRYFDHFTQAFASLTWGGNIRDQSEVVLETLGNKKEFMVLNTYRLRPIPDWAQDGMKKSVAHTVKDHVEQENSTPLAQLIVQDLQKQNAQGAGAGVADNTTRDWMTYTTYIREANQLAHELVQPTALQIADDIATEWVKRPWPYEIRSPVDQVPPFRGMNPDDRRLYYTMLAVAQSTDATAPKFTLPKIFGGYDWKLVAYAQAETFNWMEFNSKYGAGDYFESIYWVPQVSHLTGQQTSFRLFSGAPRAWRVCSLGGWEWRPRLTLADTLNEELIWNPDMVQMFEDGGFRMPINITSSNPDGSMSTGELQNASELNRVNLH